MDHEKSTQLNNLSITVGPILTFSLFVSIFIIEINVQKSTLLYDCQGLF